MRYNLLTTPLLTVKDAAGRNQAHSLPGLLAALGRGEVDSLVRAHRHQIDPIHIFLCYLAAVTLARIGKLDLAHDEAFWAERLRVLTEGADDAWCVVVDDPQRPAFMQPPVASAEQAGKLDPKAETPDEFDVLQAAKNHDVKAARMSGAAVEDWVYALISGQTMSSFLGAGNYGVARMNGGSGSRPCVGVVTSLNASERWQLDTQRLLESRDGLLAPDWPYKKDGVSLLWCVPWDGTSSIALDALDPFFIEVARIIRLKEDKGAITALGQPTNSPRVAAKNQKGNVGDPWIPITRKTGGALTISATGLTPQLLRDLLLDDEKYIRAPMQVITPGDKAVWVRVSVIVGGQGKTDGYHEAMIPVGRRPRFALAGGAERERLTRLSQWGLDQASTAQNRSLRPALFMLIEGGPEGFPKQNSREAKQWVSEYISNYAARWSKSYFPWLWEALERDDDTAKENWLTTLHTIASETLEMSIKSAPVRTNRRYRGRVRANGLFQGTWKKHLQIGDR